MKKFYLFSALLVVASILVGCSQSPDSISERTIIKQVNELLEKHAQNQSYASLEIGKFEVNEDYHRYYLRQLAEAGIITYKVDRYAWWEREERAVRESYQVRRDYYWYSYYDTEYRTVWREYFNFEDHYIVTVALTGKGEGIRIEELPEPNYEDEDLKQPEIDPESYAWNTADLSEEWPYIPNPFVEEEEEDEYVDACEECIEVEDYYDYEDEDDDVERIDQAKYESYRNLELSQETVYLETFAVEAIKARNILIYEEDGIHKATAEVILAIDDVTNFGRIMNGVEDDMRRLIEVELIFYADRGWVVVNEELF